MESEGGLDRPLVVQARKWLPVVYPASGVESEQCKRLPSRCTGFKAGVDLVGEMWFRSLSWRVK